MLSLGQLHYFWHLRAYISCLFSEWLSEKGFHTRYLKILTLFFFLFSSSSSFFIFSTTINHILWGMGVFNLFVVTESSLRGSYWLSNGK